MFILIDEKKEEHDEDSEVELSDDKEEVKTEVQEEKTDNSEENKEKEDETLEEVKEAPKEKEEHKPVEENTSDKDEVNETKEEIPTEKDNETVIDFSDAAKKVKSWFKKKETKEREHHKEEEKEDDQAIDLKEIKDKTVNFFKNLKSKPKQEEKEDSIDFINIISFCKNNSKWLIPLTLILIAIFVSTYFRMMPADLPITDDWAENTVYNFYKSRISSQIAQQYPNLPQQNRDALVSKEFEKVLEENKEQLEIDKASLSQEYKKNFQDENGNTYLLAIDPYLWYSQARNVINHGHLGDKLIDGEPHFSLRDGRLDKKSSVQLHPYIAAYLYKFLSIFNSNLTLMQALFLLPPILIGLSLIFAFLIGRKIAGNIGGFFAALFLAVNGPLLGRTPAGFSDTDPYNILLPLLIGWLAIEAYTSEKNLTKLIYSAIAGFFVGVFAAIWPPGWSSTFLMILGVIIIVPILKIAVDFIKNKYKLKINYNKDIKSKVTVLVIYLVSSAIFVTLFHSWRTFQFGLTRPIKFMALKEVGVKTIWPNVLTTVAEFNTTSFSNIIGQMGGNLLFAIAIVGILLTLLKKNKQSKRQYFYFVFLAVWLASTFYAFTKGTRFAILIAPPFALALGSALGIVYQKVSDWLHKNLQLHAVVSKILVFAVFALLLVSPITAAQNIGKNEVPSMNDAWYNALIKIRDDSPDSIITSWWDFGHWFVAIAERRVTFDGGDQSERIHWVGRTLQTDSEPETIGILRMLNCAQETAPHKLDQFTGDSLRSIKIIKDVILISNRNKALERYQELGLTKEQAEIMIDYTHCQDLLPNYYITSEDMVGKGGVWGHFGSWDFEKATMYQNTIKLSRDEAVAYLTEKFALTEERADQLHHDIQNNKADQWISSWPGYLSGQRSCENIAKDQIRCAGSLQGGDFAVNINLKTYEAKFEGNNNVVPNSIVYPTLDEIKEKEQIGQKTGFSIALIPDGENYKFMVIDPLQVAGTFTKLFFYDGHGMKCFSKFDDVRQTTGGRIITWKVNYDCLQENKVFFQEPEIIVEEQETIEELEVEEEPESEDEEVVEESLPEEETVEELEAVEESEEETNETEE